MSRWSAAYRSASQPHDTADTTDKTLPAQAGNGGCVSSVSSVMPPVDAAERAAIEAEPTIPPVGTPERSQQDDQHAAMVAGYLAASLMRPPSWWRPEPHEPPAGVACGCCRGVTWWTRDRLGWCCTRCHPATEVAGIIEVTTCATTRNTSWR
jgi:hypothetical protein